ncbi:type II toxin-antitoxin system RelE/ParE family toxin [Parasediminibacterium sp. JCM 36343]|uniref:type II toxin-antitoxin system RelE/ParE family toxin n=1 Tax=Parasediminibacterium sp. JCM 36343 TaxID=3374279 RepID=UPI00397E27B3
MSYKVITIPAFEKRIKKLAKKYPSLKLEYINLVHNLEENPIQGTPIGNNCYKIRVSVLSKGKGKRGGVRVITYVHITDTEVYLLSIYDKSEQENISSKELEGLLKWIANK